MSKRSMMAICHPKLKPFSVPNGTQRSLKMSDEKPKPKDILATRHPTLKADSEPRGSQTALKMSGKLPTCKIFGLEDEAAKKRTAELGGVTARVLHDPIHRFRNPPRPCNDSARSDPTVTTNPPAGPENYKKIFNISFL